MKLKLLAAAVAAFCVSTALPAAAQVKIGILNDQSGVYADYGGKGSVEIAEDGCRRFRW